MSGGPVRAQLDAAHDGQGTDVGLRAELAARRVHRQGRRARAQEPGRISPGRAAAGAAVSLAGVCLGIGTLLWVTDDPSQVPGPALVVPVVEDRAAPPAPDAVPLAPAAPPAAADPLAPADPPAFADPPAAAASPAVAPLPVPPAPVAAPPAVEPPSLAVPVVVLNNSRITGLADRAAERFRRGGWPVSQTGNFRGQIPVTTVYYDPGLQAEAQALADAFEGIVRVRPRFETLPARGVVVVVTREFDN